MISQGETETISRILDHLNLKTQQVKWRAKQFADDHAVDKQGHSQRFVAAKNAGGDGNIHLANYVVHACLEKTGLAVQTAAHAGQMITQDLGLKTLYLADTQQTAREMTHRIQVRFFAYQKIKDGLLESPRSSHQGNVDGSSITARPSVARALARIENEFQKTMKQYAIDEKTGQPKGERLVVLNKRLDQGITNALSAKTPHAAIRFSIDSGKLQGSVRAAKGFMDDTQRLMLDKSLNLSEKLKLKINF